MIVSSYSFIDTSTGDYQEEEVFYQEEEQENFDHLTNQGKLTLLQGSLVQSSTRARHHYLFILCLMLLSQVFTLQALLNFVYQSLLFDS